MRINNITIADISNSIKASKYPLSTDVDKCSNNITDTVLSLAQCPKGTGHCAILNRNKYKF